MQDERARSRQFALNVQSGIVPAPEDVPIPERMFLSPDETSLQRRVALLGFSFPVWRFLSQVVGGPSLLEHFGMARLARAPDLRDASLPDPARDEYGVGFCLLMTGGTYIEYRRAYILCGVAAQGCLVIRNNSWFFGRDRLPWPAAVSFTRRDVDDWQDIAPQSIADFQAIDPHPVFVQHCLELIEAHEKRLQSWLLTAGIPYLVAFLREKLARGRGVPYLGWVTDGQPPWRPHDVCALDADIVNRLETAPDEFIRPGFRLTLLSGPKGDLPVV